MRFKRISFVVTIVAVIILNTMVVCAETREINKRHYPNSNVYTYAWTGFNGKNASWYWNCCGSGEIDGYTVSFKTDDKTYFTYSFPTTSNNISHYRYQRKTFWTKDGAKSEGKTIIEANYINGTYLLYLTANWSE